ncbi:ERAD-associated protein [Tulasnella sp. 427]|nr:ERAD-associated protein [Tulasnella sp. 427]
MSSSALGGSTGSQRALREAEKEQAKLRWIIAAETGSEVAQNNLAYLFDQDKSALRHTGLVPQPSNETARFALTHWIRSASQRNVDALVKVGDYYYHGLGVSDEPEEERWEKAAGYYHRAAETQVSALALWNLGWMYENGVGVAQDFILAKRYYDMALETNHEASLPVTLSLIKLYARSIWHILTGGSQNSLNLFLGDPDSDEHWYLGKAKAEFKKKLSGGGTKGQIDGTKSDKPGSESEAGSKFTDEDDAAQWAHDRKREELDRAQAEHDADGGFGPEDYFDAATSRPGSREGFDRDDTEDDLVFMMVLTAILLVLIYMRTRYVRQDGQAAQQGGQQAPPRQ